VFERFTERAREVVVLAHEEARAFGHDYIGTEHLLLGLLREERTIAPRVLESLGVTLVEVRAQVARIVGQGDAVMSGGIPYTPRAKKVLELSLREAVSLGHHYIGTEHILLGLVREDEGVAARILLDFDVDVEKVRNEVVRILSGPSRPAVAPGSVQRARPIPAEVVEAIEKLRAEKDAAIVAGDFERAARFGGRERKLMRAAGIEAGWVGARVAQDGARKEVGGA
jgi:ATP-dependent Clp protease ATP-binding subunit ClpA